MLKLTYIFHSGFAVESDSSILIFDCWKDPAGVIPEILSTDKQLYVFSRKRYLPVFTT